jgi:hypothetical protein
LANQFSCHGHARLVPGRASTLEQAGVEAEQAFKQIRDGLSQAQYDEALWKKDGKVRGLN